ncbi:MAG: hypothetical protein QNJ67_12395 [Kiloniellales bacterium]|nr:hypothetical protein [Kiloniellales bacterium]
MHEEFSIGGVLGKTFTTLFRNIVSFGVLALLVYSPSLLLQLGAMSAGAAGSQAAEFWLVLLEALLAQVLTAAVVYGTVKDLRGQMAGLGEIVGKGFASALPVIAVAIIFTIMIGIGSLLLVVPGLIILTVFWVVIPVTVVERPGIFAAFNRSASLTKGKRWSIFALVLISVFLMIVVLMITSLFLVMLGPTAVVVGSWFLSALSAAFTAVLVAVGYHDLRIDQEGIDSGQIAAVFD